MFKHFFSLTILIGPFLSAMEELPFTKPVVLADKTELSLQFDPIAHRNAGNFLKEISEDQRFDAYEVWLSGSRGLPDDVGRIKACSEYIDDLSDYLPDGDSDEFYGFSDDTEPFFHTICIREIDNNRSMLPFLRLLKACGCNVARLDVKSMSLLFCATDPETVEFLIRCGCDVNQLTLPIVHQHPLFPPQPLSPIQMAFNRWAQNAQYEDQSMAEVVKTLFKYGAGTIKINIGNDFLDIDIWSELKYDTLAILDLNKIEELLRIHPPRKDQNPPHLPCLSPFISIVVNNTTVSKEILMLLAYYYQGDIYEVEHCKVINNAIAVMGRKDALTELFENKDILNEYKAHKWSEQNKIVTVTDSKDKDGNPEVQVHKPSMYELLKMRKMGYKIKM